MNIYPFKNNAKWYRGNLHCHSTNSDGTYSPEELKELYKAMGYSFIAYSDHDIFLENNELNDESFLALPSAELKVYGSKVIEGCGDWKTFHLCAVRGPEKNNKDNSKLNILENNRVIEPVYTDSENQINEVQKIIDDYNGMGNFVTVNHPIWSRLETEELKQLDNYFALEIFNSQCAVDYDDNGAGVLLWDSLLRQGKKVFGVAADDNHNRKYLDQEPWEKIDFNHPRSPSGKGWVMVNAENLDKDSILNSLMNGQFYSSTGPEIHDFYIENNTVNFKCSPVRKIYVVAYEQRGCGFTEGDKDITAASYKLTGREKYIRIECVDKNGNKAWTNPVFL